MATLFRLVLASACLCGLAPASAAPQADVEPLSDGWLVAQKGSVALRYRPRDPVRAARTAAAAGDARPIFLSRYLAAAGITCFLRLKEGSEEGRRGARPLDSAMGDPALAAQPPAPGQNLRRERVREWFATQYNRTVIASPAFPYPDVCTSVPADRGVLAQRNGLAAHASRDDGSPAAAIRLGRMDLLRQRLAANPASFGEPDADFGIAPIGWAFAAGRMDMIEALIAAGADPTRREGFDQLFYYTLVWGRRDAALWLIDHAKSWGMLRQGEDVLDVTVEALGSDLALRILNKFGTTDPREFVAMVEAGMYSAFRTKHRAFWLSLLSDPRWRAACVQPYNRCAQFTSHIVYRGTDEEVTAFFNHGWRPSPSAISELMWGMAQQLDAPRIALLATFPYDRATAASIRLPPPPPTPVFVPVRPPVEDPVPTVVVPGERPDTPAERQAAAEEARERQRKLTETVAVLRKIGVPAERLRQ